jgi:hypothetical protein
VSTDTAAGSSTTTEREVIYRGTLAPLERALIAAVIVVGYAGAVRKLRRQAAVGMTSGLG